MKKYLNILISFTLITGAMGLIFLWEIYLDDTINTVKVVVAAKNLEKNQVLKDGDVKIEKIKIHQAVDKPINEIKEVIGQETIQYIPKGNQFVEQMIDKYGLEPNHDQYIYSIPKEWIYSSPGSMRRKDRVYIYPIPSNHLESFNITRGLKTNELNNTVSANAAISENNIESPTKPLLKNIVVAFAKDSSNNEVKPVPNSDKRIDATGSINNLELIMTEKQYSLLERKFLDGYKFNFAYK